MKKIYLVSNSDYEGCEDILCFENKADAKEFVAECEAHVELYPN